MADATGPGVTRRVRLGIDAATDRLSVAADRGEGGALELTVDGTRRHAAALPPLLDRLLAGLDASSGEVGLVAVSDGPGGFTGLRVGIAVAKALACGRGVPLHAAPSLLVRAAAVARDGEAVLAVAPALRGEVYAGAWRIHRTAGIVAIFRPRPIGPGAVADLPEVNRIVGDGPEELRRALVDRYGIAPDPVWPSAAALLDLTTVPGGAAPVENPALWEPEYGRPAEAQVQWERRHRRPLPDPNGTSR